MNFQGKTAVVTGGTDGIGKAVALQLAQQGAAVILVGRRSAKGEQAAQNITSATQNKDVQCLAADLTRLADTNHLAEQIGVRFNQLDFLIHSAGVMLNEKRLTNEGLEEVMAVQYVTRFWLTERLLPLLQQSENGSVVTVAGGSRFMMKGDSLFNYKNFNAEQKFNGLTRLQETGAANFLWTLDFNQRYEAEGLRLYNYYPGFVKTTLGKSMPAPFRLLMKGMMPLMARTPEQAAKPLLLLLSGSAQGGFYDKKLQQNEPDITAVLQAEIAKLRAVSLSANKRKTPIAA